MANLRIPLPSGLGGQISGIIFAGLLLSQIVAFAVYSALVPEWHRELRPQEAVTKLAVTTRALEGSPTERRPELADLLSDPHFHVTVDAAAAGYREDESRDETNRFVRSQLANRLAKDLADVQVHFATPQFPSDLRRLAVRLSDGAVVSVIAPIGAEHRLGRVEQGAILVFMLAVLIGVWIWIARLVSEPLRRVASAAERVGLDVKAEPVAEQGPTELRRVIAAFNQMQARVKKMLDDRTFMLGALGHDLMTPLTRLRLRIEAQPLSSDRERMLSAIDSMESMVASALDFVRGVDDAEPLETVDLNLAVQTVCDNLADLGGNILYRSPGRCRLRCKPHALMRAITNVAANACKYGSSARVTLRANPGAGYEIDIEDDGPGIPDAEKSRVFDPFYRADNARSGDARGMGLGLSIAKSIIVAHGGTIELLDATPTGLLARIRLPLAS